MKYKNNQSVLVVIYAVETGRVLMLRRNDAPDFWQSVTGSIENGETAAQTVLRELREEIGVDLNAPESAQNFCFYDSGHSVEFEIFPQFRYKYAPNTSHCREQWFVLAASREFAPILTEHSAFQWLPKIEAATLTKSPNNAQAIELFVPDSD